MSSKYVDNAAITQIIGTVFNYPEILDEEDKYCINEEDFVEEFHKIVFGSILNIHNNDSKVTIDTIIDYLASRPKFEVIFNKNNGVEYIKEASNIAFKDSFNYYYNRMKKFTLLRAYDKIGVDVRFLYDVDNILDVKKKQKQEDWLDNTTLGTIADLIDKKIENIRNKYVDERNNEPFQAGDGISELIEELRKRPEVGIPMYGPLINTVTRGARLRKFYIRSASTGQGKAIPNETIIPTPNGYKKVGDIKPGDYLFGQNGKPTKVLQIHPQQEKKQIYEVKFADGRIAKCCKDHLWEYRYRDKRYRVESVEQILNRVAELQNGFKDSCGKGFRFHVKINQPVDYFEKKYSVPPYVMGALLGDGSFRYNKTNKALNFSSETDEIPKKIAKLLGCSLKKNSDFNYSYVFKPLNNLNHNLWVEEVLKDYPELWQCKSEDKFIPEDYLLGSIEQRMELLRGLLDTDGSITSEKGEITFSTTSSRLKNDIIELTRSLGMIPTYSIDKYSNGKSYTVYIQCKKDIKPQLFSLKSKVKKAEEYASSSKKNEYKDHLAIISIEPIEEEVDMTCFTVDNEDHLFLMNDFIVTHNTRALVADACYFSCGEIYDKRWGTWIKTGKGQPTLFIATEQDKSEIQTMALAFLAEVNEQHILDGKYENDEYERVLRAGEILKNAPLWIEEVPDFSLTDIELIIKKNIRDRDVRYVCYDYIHTSMKILEEITKRSGGVKLREDNALFMLSTKLKDICNQYDVFIISATQLNANYQDSETPDQNLLRGE